MRRASIDLVHELYAAMTEYDFAAIPRLLHPAIEWDVSRLWPDGEGIYQGHVEVERRLRDLAEAGQFQMEPVEVVPAGDTTVLGHAVLRLRGGGSGAEAGVHVFHLWTIEDGKALRFCVYLDRDEALAAAQRGEERDSAQADIRSVPPGSR